MKCRICYSDAGQNKIVLKEMMFGFRDEFGYFQCPSCKCFQIIEIPGDLQKYYPEDYYSYNTDHVLKKPGYFRWLQYAALAKGRKGFWSKLLTYRYPPPDFYQWLINLRVTNRKSRILDVGCGNGELLKKMYRTGFKDLTGIDPFNKATITYNDRLRILKKDLFDLTGKYDIIMLHHSLEHMAEQHDILGKLFTLLNDNGKILFRLPIVSEPLLKKYGANVVSLDPPRHFFIHSQKSIQFLLNEKGFTVYKKEFDAHAFSFIASEQYANNISIHNNERSYFENPSNSIFTEEQVAAFDTAIRNLNEKESSDNIVLYARK